MAQVIQHMDVFQPEQSCVHLDKVAGKFYRRFGEFDVMEDIAAVVSKPHKPIDK